MAQHCCSLWNRITSETDSSKNGTSRWLPVQLKKSLQKCLRIGGTQKGYSPENGAPMRPSSWLTYFANGGPMVSSSSSS